MINMAEMILKFMLGACIGFTAVMFIAIIFYALKEIIKDLFLN